MNKKLLRLKMLEKDRTLQTLAEALGVHRNTLRNWVRSESIPLRALVTIKDTLDMSDDEFIDTFIAKEPAEDTSKFII